MDSIVPFLFFVLNCFQRGDPYSIKLPFYPLLRARFSSLGDIYVVGVNSPSISGMLPPLQNGKLPFLPPPLLRPAHALPVPEPCSSGGLLYLDHTV